MQQNHSCNIGKIVVTYDMTFHTVVTMVAHNEDISAIWQAYAMTLVCNQKNLQS